MLHGTNWCSQLWISWFWVITWWDNERAPVLAAVAVAVAVAALAWHFPIQLRETRRKVKHNECIHARMLSELARACQIKPDMPATSRCWATNSFRLTPPSLQPTERQIEVEPAPESESEAEAAVHDGNYYTRAPIALMTTGWQWLRRRRHCWRRCTWVYSRDHGKQPMHTEQQQIAHTPCMPSRSKRQRILSLINEQVTTADKGESQAAL